MTYSCLWLAFYVLACDGRQGIHGSRSHVYTYLLHIWHSLSCVRDEQSANSGLPANLQLKAKDFYCSISGDEL